jgi:intracellular multiplication protein IcmJ
MIPATTAFLGGGLVVHSPFARSAGTMSRRGLPAGLVAAVVERDRFTCRVCAFRSSKFQQVMILGGSGKDPELLATACIFCHQSFHLDWVPVLRSGVFIWLPEVDQAKLHHIAREVYVHRQRKGDIAARRALDHLMSRRNAARELLGTESLDEVVSIVRENAGRLEAVGDRLAGLRLMPLDRRILRRGQIEFNQFPQILQYWRSKEGPMGRSDAHPHLDWYLKEVAGENIERKA